MSTTTLEKRVSNTPTKQRGEVVKTPLTICEAELTSYAADLHYVEMYEEQYDGHCSVENTAFEKAIASAFAQ